MHSIKTTWDPKSIAAFDHEIMGHVIRTDGTPPHGEDTGPSPKRLLLASLAGCTGVDVVSLLKKMRAPVDSYEMEVEADLTDEHPKTYSEIRLIYRFSGPSLKEDKITKAVNLSLDRYCGVTKMLAAHCPIVTSIEFEHTA